MTLFPSWHFPPQLPPTHHPTHPLRPSLSPFLPPCPYWTFDSLKRGEQVGSKGCGLLPPSFSPLFPLMRPLIERLPGSRRESAAHSSTNRLGLPRAGPSAPPPPSISLEGGGGGGGTPRTALTARLHWQQPAGAQRTQRRRELQALRELRELFCCTPTTQCIKFVLLLLNVTVQIKGLSLWQQSRAWPTASEGTPLICSLGSPRLFAFQCQAHGKSLAEKM